MRDLSDATLLKHLSHDTIEFLRALPVARELDTRHGRLLLCHGLGANDMASVGPDDFGYALESNLDLQGLLKAEHLRFVVNGHTHRRMVRAFGALTIINAGTLKQEHEPGFLVLDVAENEVLALTMRADGSVNGPQTLAELTTA
jgi:predicted phosphodiesterase